MTGPMEWSLASKDVVTPKFAPAPRRAQKSSGSVSVFTTSVRASAVKLPATAAAAGQAKKVLGDAGEAAQQVWSQAGGVAEEVVDAGRRATKSV